MVEQSDLDVTWTLVADAGAFEAAVSALAEGDGPVGVDVERASGFRYSQRAYLVQMHRRGAGTFLFDPTGIPRFAPLENALADEEWIFHAASQDLPSLREIGLVPSRLFDTELSARLLGLERVGLGAVVEQMLGISLAKEHSANDWSTRPLPDSWLEYAALDVALLPDLRDVLDDRLGEAGKREFALQEFEAERIRPPKPPRDEPWRKVTSNSMLRSARARTIARELWLARDALAVESDVAPGRLFPDKSLLAAAAAAPRSADDLARLRSFRGRASRTELQRWWQAILRGKTTTQLVEPAKRGEQQIPNHRGWSAKHPEAAARLSRLRDAVSSEAERRAIPAENLLTPAILRAIAWAPPQPPTEERMADQLARLGARPWQVQITSPVLAQAVVESA